MKRCSRCKEEKPFSEFAKHKDKGYQSHCRPCNNEVNAERRKADPRIQIIDSARYRAKKIRLPFDIVKEDIKIPEYCPVLRIPLIFGKGAICQNSPTLDKVIPKKGYVKDNIVVVSMRANSLKRDATIQELRRIADYYEQFEFQSSRKTARDI